MAEAVVGVANYANSAGYAETSARADACSGNSSTAKRLETPRKITLTGDAQATAYFDGSADITLTVKNVRAESATKDSFGNNIAGTYSTKNNSGGSSGSGTNANYVTKNELQTYMQSYLTKTDAGITYLSKVDAAKYLTKEEANVSYGSSGDSSIAVTAATAEVSYRCAGNADTASKFSETRTITLTGDAESEFKFDGSSDVVANVKVVRAESAMKDRLGNDIVDTYVNKNELQAYQTKDAAESSSSSAGANYATKSELQSYLTKDEALANYATKAEVSGNNSEIFVDGNYLCWRNGIKLMRVEGTPYSLVPG